MQLAIARTTREATATTENRTGGEGEGADADRGQTRATKPATISRRPRERRSGNLADEADQAAHRQEQADVDLRPFLGREKHRDKGTEPGLDVSDKEHQPIKPSPAAQILSRAFALLRFSDVIPQRFGQGFCLRIWAPAPRLPTGGACGPPMMTMGSPSL